LNTSRTVKYLSVIKVHPKEGFSVDRDWTWNTVNEFHSGFACFWRRRPLAYSLKNNMHVTSIKVNLLLRKLKQSRANKIKPLIVFLKSSTVEPGFNKPLCNEVRGITNDFPGPSNGKIYGKEPRYNETSLYSSKPHSTIMHM